ncbi:MAG: CDP-alcohol phosphatidyltransferase family protein [Bacteroidota bacterium]|nr:CDP-alcohol phosphatidyltransferase family protein [Bacteroidota bacterium]
MKMFSIPNLITLGNLLCGCLAIVFAFEGNLVWAAYLVGIAAVLDFLDGFVARALKQYSEIGKQLDSLADMVTFGVVPGVVMFKLLDYSFRNYHQLSLYDLSGSIYDLAEAMEYRNHWYSYLPYVGFLIVLFSALRLAKFNIDTRQSDSFIGVPTPANAILICSIPLIYNTYNLMAGNSIFMSRPDVKDPGLISFYKNFPVDGFAHSVCTFLTNPIFLLVLTILMCYLLISEIPLFSLKFKSFGWKGNEIRWSFLTISILLLVTLQFMGIPLAIVLYVLMSVGNNMMRKKGG